MISEREACDVLLSLGLSDPRIWDHAGVPETGPVFSATDPSIGQCAFVIEQAPPVGVVGIEQAWSFGYLRAIGWAKERGFKLIVIVRARSCSEESMRRVILFVGTVSGEPDCIRIVTLKGGWRP